MTAEKKKDPTRLVTPEGRISFPKVYKPEAYEDQEPKYSCVLLISKKADMTPFKKAIHAAKLKTWGTDESKWPKVPSPLRDGDEKEDLDGYAGHYFLTASNKQRPAIVDRNLAPISEDSGDFYAGCYGRLAIRAYAWEFKGKNGAVMKRGVSFALDHVQKLRDGEPFSGKPKVEDVFDSVEDDDAESGAGGEDEASDWE